MLKPMCRLCGERHWAYEQHTLGPQKTVLGRWARTTPKPPKLVVVKKSKPVVKRKKG
jgi:hypothetical protein